MTDTAPCDESCTVDCGRCKGKPIFDLKRRVRRALWFGRDSHGGVPWDEKDRWRQGYDAAKREVLMVLSACHPAESAGGTDEMATQ